MAKWSPKPKTKLDEKHEEQSRARRALRATQAWEKTDAGKASLALSAEFSAKWRGQWMALEAVAKVLRETGHMILVVSGGRSFCETHDVTGREVKALDEAMAERRALGLALDWIRPTSIIQGGQHGADRWAAIWCERRGIECVTVDAKWTELGHRAGPERNQRMIDEYAPDAGCVFPGGVGTADCKRRMDAAKLPVYEVAVSDLIKQSPPAAI